MESTQTSQQPTDDTDSKIRVEEVTKRFGRLTAVDSVSLSIRPGEIFALVGDNGAGKSTLMNVICGVYQPTSGRVYVEENPVSFSNPSDARDRGIETVYQDLELMDVATNIFMGRFPTHVSLGPLKIIDWGTAYDRAEQILDDLGQDLDPTSEVEFLSGGERQLVAVARSITFDPDVLILDEPTSALSFAGAELVHETMERLKDEGRTQIVVSHDIAEVYRLADRIGVMYQGSLVDVVDPDEAPRDEVESLIRTGQRDKL
ncbi:MAG: ATP-binding cassette domain-containing protein [Haloarculaceae archaeon]